MQRGWQAISGLATLFLITQTLSLTEQGWYYAFLSVAAVYVLLDFGLSVLLVQLSAHAFIGLRWGRNGAVDGSGVDRFLALCRKVTAWYGWAVPVYLLLIPFGFGYFSRGGEVTPLGYEWRLPWVLTVVATSASLFVLPWTALVEGTGRVREAYLVRLIQSVVGTLLLWVALLSGAGLYAAAVAPSCTFLVACLWAMYVKRGLLREVLAANHRHFNWRTEVMPLQWRMGVSWVCGYLLVQIHVPLLFRVQGAAEAAQMGLSLTIANMLGLLAQSWVVSRLPNMTQLAAKHEWNKMDRSFAQGFRWALAAYVAGAAAMILFRHWLLGTSYSQRLLPEPEFALLMLAGFAAHWVGLLASQVRTYRRDPFVISSIVTAALLVAGVLWAAPRYSYTGVVAVMVLINLVVYLPWVAWLFRRCNKIWRASGTGANA